MFAVLPALCFSDEAIDAETLFSPPANPPATFSETFQDGLSQWKTADDATYPGEFEVGVGKENTHAKMAEERELLVTEGAKKYGLISKEFHLNTQDGFVFQYEVRLHEGLQCGGAYMKLLAAGTDPENFDDKSRYSVMFGPDKCGATNKVHFILEVYNPASEEFHQHHLRNPPTVKSDKKTHLYTVATRGQKEYEIFIDLESVKSGSFADDFDPPFQPPEEINDPDDSKPEDWIDDEMMDDPEDSKPDDWDEDAPAMINDPEKSMPECWQPDAKKEIEDPEANRPDDWDDEDDGDFEAPLIPNPACTPTCGCGEWTHEKVPNPDYKGKWYPQRIENPDYKGEWAPGKINNPGYYVIKDSDRRVNDIHQVAIDIWTMQSGIGFDNIYIGEDPVAAHEFAKASFQPKQEAEKQAAKAKGEERGSGPLDMVKAAVMENPGKLMFTAVIVAITLIYFCCCGSGDDEPVGTQVDEPAGDVKAAKDEEGSEEAEADDAPQEEAKSKKTATKKKKRKD